MADNSQKLHAARALNKIGEDRANADREVASKGVPCSVVAVNGHQVTVKLEMQSNSVTLPQITIPQHFSTYTREPTQVGDKGRALPSNYGLSGVSGDGGGADLYPRFNLSALAFHPIAQKSFNQWDGTKHNLNGPNGAVMQTADGSVKIDIDKASGNVIITTQGSVVINGNLTVTGNITGASGSPQTAVDILNHTHQGVMPGSATTGKPVAGS